MMGFIPTKKATDEIIKYFFNERHSIFSDRKRTTKSAEEKVLDAIYYELGTEYFPDEASYRNRVDGILICCTRLADKFGFMKIIYDFVLMCNNNY